MRIKGEAARDDFKLENFKDVDACRDQLLQLDRDASAVSQQDYSAKLEALIEIFEEIRWTLHEKLTMYKKFL